MQTTIKRKSCNFKIGDTVHAIAFDDCFDVHHKPVHDLIVASVTYHAPSSRDILKGYWRIDTRYQSGRQAVEGSERFFKIGGVS